MDFLACFLAADYAGVEYDGAAFVKGLARYIDSAKPIFGPKDHRLRAMHEYLWTAKPDPKTLLGLLGPRRDATGIEDWILRRDLVAWSVVTSLYRRLDAGGDDHVAGLYDAVTFATVNFGFDPLYGESHTRTSQEVADLFLDPELRPCPESEAATRKHLEALLRAWRARVTKKATTTLIAILLRHLGPAGGDRMFSEWKNMDETERTNLLLLAAEYEDFSTATRVQMVHALRSGSIEVREAALKALEAQGAPVAGIDIGARDEDLRESLEALLKWASKTDS